MKDQNEPTESVTPVASDALLSRLDAKRGMYFFNWLMGEWLSDPCGLEHVSVKTIIETYDKRSGNSMFSDNKENTNISAK